MCRRKVISLHQGGIDTARALVNRLEAAQPDERLDELVKWMLEARCNGGQGGIGLLARHFPGARSILSRHYVIEAQLRHESLVMLARGQPDKFCACPSCEIKEMPLSSSELRKSPVVQLRSWSHGLANKQDRFTLPNAHSACSFGRIESR